MEIAIDPTARLSLTEIPEEVTAIKTVEDGREDPTLTNAIGHSEGLGNFVIPMNIGSLESVNEDQNPDEDERHATKNHF